MNNKDTRSVSYLCEKLWWGNKDGSRFNLYEYNDVNHLINILSWLKKRLVRIQSSYPDSPDFIGGDSDGTYWEDSAGMNWYMRATEEWRTLRDNCTLYIQEVEKIIKTNQQTTHE